MTQAEQFYPGLHEQDAKYSAGEYHMASLLNHGVLLNWLRNYSGKPLRILDVGCGKGLFLREFVNGVRQRTGINDFPVTGTDLVLSPQNFHSQVSPDFKFVQLNLDGNTLPFDDQSYDFVCCNHVLEHIFQTEKLVREFRRVVSQNGMCLISVPNLAAWVNRVFFLFAGQPLGSELGTETVTYGFGRLSCRRNWSRFGHRGTSEISRREDWKI